MDPWENEQGAIVLITTFGDFHQFSAKKAFFLEINVMNGCTPKQLLFESIFSAKNLRNS
jgi:hypothetical protein